uniref:Uncharacterized protein n=1 Tax=Nelumbo nucifera TaxID=4432 RepID=A0A822YIK3_NELNU|nr:TPA_asm: hypothetical protein HUJ06_011261 [Nelumbo nucifera]
MFPPEAKQNRPEFNWDSGGNSCILTYYFTAFSLII